MMVVVVEAEIVKNGRRGIRGQTHEDSRQETPGASPELADPEKRAGATDLGAGRASVLLLLAEVPTARVHPTTRTLKTVGQERRGDPIQL